MDALTHTDDAQLVAQALNGRADAYGELVRRHQRTVYNAAYRLVGNAPDALDLAQEAFLRAYHALDTFDAARPFAPWIHTIVTRLALNLLEKTHPHMELDETAAQVVGDETAGTRTNCAGTRAAGHGAARVVETAAALSRRD